MIGVKFYKTPHLMYLTLDKMRVAIIGSGPSSFYVTKYLIDKISNVYIDIFESLPVPFGLLRYGVAPDHPEVKSATNQFIELFNSNSNKIRFFGNIKVGEDISVENLQSFYKYVVLACGCQSEVDLKINGDNSISTLSSRRFVNWFNGHPDVALDNSIDFRNVEDVVIIGNGNVSLDCARILTKPIDELCSTDISNHALEILAKSRVKRVTIIGRRGPIQASFTIKELRELSNLNHVKVRFHEDDFRNGLNKESNQEIDGNRPKQRLLELMKKMIAQTDMNSISTSQKVIDFKFLRSPIKISQDSNSNLTSLSTFLNLEKNQLSGPAFNQQGISTGVFEDIPCQLLIKAIGYGMAPIPGLPFNPKRFLNIQGRLVSKENGDIVRGLYVTGWAKRGAIGIIGSNIPDAKETVESIWTDMTSNDLPFKNDNGSIYDTDMATILPVLTSDQVVTWDKFIKINEEEIRRGSKYDPPKPREKILTRSEMLTVANSLT
jgi:NADPH-dependent glutamate synthase beta subunit-like oxidoreductase